MMQTIWMIENLKFVWTQFNENIKNILFISIKCMKEFFGIPIRNVSTSNHFDYLNTVNGKQVLESNLTQVICLQCTQLIN